MEGLFDNNRSSSQFPSKGGKRTNSRNHRKQDGVWCENVPYIPTSYDGIHPQACPVDWGCESLCYQEPQPDPTTIPIYLGWLAELQYQECCPDTTEKCGSGEREQPQPFDCNPNTKYHPCPKPRRRCKSQNGCDDDDNDSWISKCDDDGDRKRDYGSDKYQPAQRCIPCGAGK